MDAEAGETKDVGASAPPLYLEYQKTETKSTDDVCVGWWRKNGSFY